MLSFNQATFKSTKFYSSCRLNNYLAMGINDELKVLGMRQSPYVNRVQLALNLKSLEYDFILEKTPRTQKSELLLKLNPVHKKVPVLIHNDKPICESLAIVEYIDEVWTTDHSILPSDPYERANARFWAAYIDLKLFPAVEKLVELTHNEDTKRATATEEVNEAMILLEDAFAKISKREVFFGGNEIGYLDIVFGCGLGWLKAVEIMNKVKFLDEINTPRLFRWATAFFSHIATENAVPRPEELIEYHKSFQAKLAAAADVSN